MSGGSFLLSFTLVLQARLAPIPRLKILGAFMLPFSLSHLNLVCSRSATLDLAIAQTRLSSARGLKYWTWCCFARTGTFCGSHLASFGSSASVFAPVPPSRCLMCGGILAFYLCWHINVHVPLLCTFWMILLIYCTW